MKLEDYDTYLFDWDGTIANSFSLWLALVREVLSGYGVDASDAVIVRRIFGRLREGLLEFGVPSDQAETVIATLVEKAQTNIPHAPLYPGIYDLLQELHAQGKRLGVVTAGPKPVIHAALQSRGLADIFDVVVTGSEVAKQKPDPEGLLLAMRQLKVPPSRVIMLGDSEKDILAAHNAGIDSVLFYPAEHALLHDLEGLRAAKPTYIINSWADMIQRAQSSS